MGGGIGIRCFAEGVTACGDGGMVDGWMSGSGGSRLVNSLIS